MSDYTQNKKVLQELVKARESVKRKYNLIKYQKDDNERVFKETFKPIINPLQELVESKKIKNSSPADVEQKFNEPEEEDEATIPQSDEDEEITIPFKDRDKIYGVRKVGNEYKLGKCAIRFTKFAIYLNDLIFPKTRGLYNLIIHKQPVGYDSSDLAKYKEVLQESCAHKKNYSHTSSIKSHSRSSKYNKIIAPLFGLNKISKRKKVTYVESDDEENFQGKKGLGLIPRFKVARHNTHMDYVYWDDPNELVERLRLLIAEQTAGNPIHTNEIHSIIEELRESKHIY